MADVAYNFSLVLANGDVIDTNNDTTDQLELKLSDYSSDGSVNLFVHNTSFNFDFQNQNNATSIQTGTISFSIAIASRQQRDLLVQSMLRQTKAIVINMHDLIFAQSTPVLLNNIDNTYDDYINAHIINVSYTVIGGVFGQLMQSDDDGTLSFYDTGTQFELPAVHDCLIIDPGDGLSSDNYDWSNDSDNSVMLLDNGNYYDVQSVYTYTHQILIVLGPSGINATSDAAFIAAQYANDGNIDGGRDFMISAII